MNIIENLIAELKREAEVTEKFLSLVPADKFDWKMHPKSMNLKALSTHIAEIAGWIALIKDTDEIDFAEGYQPAPVTSTDDLLNIHREGVEKSLKALESMDEKVFDDMWTMRYGDKIIGSSSKYDNFRHAFSQNTHHRAQLGCAFRLLEIPVPGSYGPSADDTMGW